MLHLHSSNQFEVLERTWLDHVERSSRTPLEACLVLVSAHGVGRRLKQSLARRVGVSALVKAEFLAQWIWRTMAKTNPAIAEETPLSTDALTWRVLQSFADPKFAAHARPRLGPYLQAADDVMRHELAHAIARLFETYTIERRDWLARWARGQPALSVQRGAPMSEPWRQDEAWLGALWHWMAADQPWARQDPYQRWQQLVQLEPERVRASLPRALHLMAPTDLAAVHWTWLQAASTLVDVHVYVLNPCQAYWFDLIDEKQRLRWAALTPSTEQHSVDGDEWVDGGDHRESGPRLLAHWGRTQQAVLGLVHDQTTVDCMNGDASSGGGGDFVQPGLTTRLTALQQYLLTLEPQAPARRDGADDSLEVHACHSLRRQLEALHNRLLALLASPGAPSLDQMVVVLPQLEQAVPLIEAVFGSAQGPRRIDYTITGRESVDPVGASRALLALMDLGHSRVGLSDLMACLHEPLVMQAFAWTDADLGLLEPWLRDAGMRHGIDASQRASTVPELEATTTLGHAIERMQLALMVGNVTTPLLDQAPPWPRAAGLFDPAQTTLLASLVSLRDELLALSHWATQSHAPSVWHGRLMHLLGTWLAARTRDEDEALAILRQQLSDWLASAQAADFHSALPWRVVKASLLEQLKSQARGGVPAGSLAFTSMSALRTLPYQGVAVLGLDSGAFPSRTQEPEFDLRSAAPRRGDRHRRDDQRQQMLDCLTSARRHLWLFYTGRDQHSNEVLPPSTLVDDLIETCALLESVPGATMRAQLVVEHPLQPFDASLFSPKAKVQRQSFQTDYALALQQAAQRQAQASVAGHRLATASAFAHNLVELALATAGDPEDEDTEAEETEAEWPDDAHHADAWQAGMPLWQKPLPAWSSSSPLAEGSAESPLSLTSLIRCLENPAQAWLGQRLGIRATRLAALAEDHDPFNLDALTRSAWVGQLMPLALAGAPASRLMAELGAGAGLPGGPIGGQYQVQLVESVLSQAAWLKQHEVLELPPPLVLPFLTPQGVVHLKLAIGGTDERVSVTKAGLCGWHSASLQAKQKLRAWLHHLAWQCLCPSGVAPITRWVTRKQHWVLAPLAEQAAEARAMALHELGKLVELWQQGLLAPLPFAPDSSWALVEAQSKAKAHAGSVRRAVNNAWQPYERKRAGDPNPYRRGDTHDPALQWAWRGHGRLIDHPDFEAVAQQVFGTAITVMQEVEA